MKLRLKFNGLLAFVFTLLFTSFSFAAGDNNFNYSNYETEFVKALVSVDKSVAKTPEYIGAGSSGITVDAIKITDSGFGGFGLDDAIKKLSLHLNYAINHTLNNNHYCVAIVTNRTNKNKHDRYNAVAVNRSDAIIKTSVGVGQPISGFIIRSA